MTQSTHPDIGKRVLVECTVEGINEYHTGILSGVSDEWYELITDEDVIYRVMPEYWKYTVIEDQMNYNDTDETQEKLLSCKVKLTDKNSRNFVEYGELIAVTDKWYKVVTDDGFEIKFYKECWECEMMICAEKQQDNKPPKLQDGMVVEVQEDIDNFGKRYIVLGETLVNSSGYNNRCAYDEDLLMHGDIDNGFTIVKVYKPIKIKNLKSLFNMDDSIFARNEMELLWERKAIPTEQEQEQHIIELEEQIDEMKKKVSTMKQKVNELRGTL